MASGNPGDETAEAPASGAETVAVVDDHVIVVIGGQEHLLPIYHVNGRDCVKRADVDALLGDADFTPAG